MITLPVKPLLEFIRLSSPIVTNSILPIHKYIKLEGKQLSKTNGHSFITHVIDCDNTSAMLLEEVSISAFAKYATGEDFNVSVADMANSAEFKITLSDGNMKEPFQSPPVKLFDKLPTFNEDEAIELDRDALEIIGSAAKCVGSIGGNAAIDFVYLYEGFVYGTDQQRVISKKMQGLPNAIFDRESATTISQFNSVKFYQSDKHNLFKTGNTVYGFQKYELKPLDLRVLIDRKVSGDYMELQSSDVLRGCEWISSAVVLKGQDVLLCELGDGKIYCRKEEYGKDAEIKIPITGELKSVLKFNPKFLAPYIKALGIPTIRLYEFIAPVRMGDKVQNVLKGFFVTDPDDNDFLGMISTIAE